MKIHEGILLVIIVAAYLVGMALGIFVGEINKTVEWQKLMIEKGYAEMVPSEEVKTFKWKN